MHAIVVDLQQHANLQDAHLACTGSLIKHFKIQNKGILDLDNLGCENVVKRGLFDFFYSKHRKTI